MTKSVVLMRYTNNGPITNYTYHFTHVNCVLYRNDDYKFSMITIFGYIDMSKVKSDVIQQAVSSYLNTPEGLKEIILNSKIYNNDILQDIIQKYFRRRLQR